MQISIIIYYLSINWPTHISNNNDDDSNSNSHNDNDDDNNSSNNNNARIHTQWTYLPVAVYIIRGW